MEHSYAVCLRIEPTCRVEYRWSRQLTVGNTPRLSRLPSTDIESKGNKLQAKFTMKEGTLYLASAFCKMQSCSKF